jgi:branched-chain amino acid transport system substrate-binding protein
MKWRVRLVIPFLAAAAAAPFGQTACSSGSGGSNTTTNDGGGGGDITIGFSNALTGGLAGNAAPLNDAARVAEQQVNQVGVLGGRHIRIEIFDDLSDAKTGAPNAATHFIGEKVPAVLGPLTSGQCLAVDKMFAANKIVEISPSATSPALTTDQPMTDRYFFRTAPADDFQGKAVTKLMYDGVPTIATSDAGSNMVGGGCRNAYLVNADDGYGNGLMNVVHDTFLGRPGARVLGWDKVSTSLAPDYKQEAQTVVNAINAASAPAGSTCLVLVVYSDVGAQFLRDLRTAMNATCTSSGCPAFTFPVYGSDGQHDSPYIPNCETIPGDLTSPNVCATVVGTAPDTTPATPQYQVFQTMWQSSFPGQQPPQYAANLYDAVLVLALAIEQAGTATDGQAIRDALYKVTNPNGATTFGPDKFVGAESAIVSGIPVKYIGASGPMTFDQYGNVTGDYIVWRVDKQADGTMAYDTMGRISSSQLP